MRLFLVTSSGTGAHIYVMAPDFNAAAARVVEENWDCSTIQDLGEPLTWENPVAEQPELVPAVPIKKSVTHDWLISLEDGKKYKMLRRHLALRGMTPDKYRAKWGLPDSYPMVAPGYSEVRSKLAIDRGLGTRK